MISAKLQVVVGKASKWSGQTQLKLTSSQCEVAVFSNDTAGSEWTPRPLGNRRLTVNTTPTFPGVRYDRSLRFCGHAREVRQQMIHRLSFIRRLGITQWGWRKSQLRMVYLALIRSIAEHAAPAWFPWTSKSTVDQLESAQLVVARAITNLMGPTPKEVV